MPSPATPPPVPPTPAAREVRLFVMDMDGTLTDGTRTDGPDGG